jgi:transcription antitermination factor NusG
VTVFSGFTDADFDAYVPKKALSHLYNRERLETKQKLLALGAQIGGRMTGSDGAPLACEASAEHPALWNHKRVDAQHLFFSRNAAARQEIEGLIDKGRTLASLIDDPTPYRKHVFLSAGIDADKVEIALKLHADARIDRDNLERKCQEYFHRERLTTILRALPEENRIGVVGGTSVSPAELDDDRLRAVLAEFAGGGSWLFAGRAFARTDPLVRDARFSDVAREEMARLLPAFHFVAWTRDNDFVSIKESLRQAAVERRVGHLERGDRVRIVRCVLSGKSGVVQEVGDKGVKLLVGKMSVKVDGGDLAKF